MHENKHAVDKRTFMFKSVTSKTVGHSVWSMQSNTWMSAQSINIDLVVPGWFPNIGGSDYMYKNLMMLSGL